MHHTHQKKLSVIGAGAVGSTLAIMLYRSGYHVVSIISRRKESARTLARQVKCNLYSNSLRSLPAATEIIMMAVPEEYLRELQVNLRTMPRSIFHASLCSIHPVP